MVHTVRSAAIAAFLAAAAPSVTAEAAPAIRSVEIVPPAAREAAAAVDSFHAALRRGDTEAARALLVDDVLVFEQGGAERSKAEYSARHLAADAEFSKAVAGVRTRRTGDAAGDFAWIASEVRTKGAFRGRAVDRVMDETMILRRVGGTWKIVHIHWSSAQSSVE